MLKGKTNANGGDLVKKYMFIAAVLLLVAACSKRAEFGSGSPTNAGQSDHSGAQYGVNKHVYRYMVIGKGGIVYYGYQNSGDEVKFYTFIGKDNGTYYAIRRNGTRLLSCTGACNVIKSDQFLAAPVYPGELKEYLSHNSGGWSNSLAIILSAALKANNVLEEYASTRTDFGNYTTAGGVMHDARSGYMKPMETENGITNGGVSETRSLPGTNGR